MAKHSGKVVSFNRFRWCTVQQVMDWCCVSRASAYGFMSGRRVPGPQSVKLFYLHRDGRILDDGWEGFTVKGDVLITPSGQSFTANQLQLFGLLYQYAQAVQSEHRDAKLGKLLQEFQQA